MGTEMK